MALTEPALGDPLGGHTLAELVAAAHARDVAAVIVIDADPVRTAPRVLGVAGALAAAPWSLHVGAHRDATARACRAHLPLAHELETWSDPRAYDGTLAIAQPLVRPRFDVASPIDVLAALADDERDAHSLVRSHFADEATWRDALRAGVVANTRLPAVEVGAPSWPPSATGELALALAPPAGPLEIALARSPQVHDGRFAANAWLQELPHPITKQTWGNAALLGATTADALGITDEDIVRVTTTAGAIELPALVVPGAVDGSITIELGHGQLAPAIAAGIGADAFALRDGRALVLRGAAMHTGRRGRAIRTQTTTTEHGRAVAPTTTLARFHADASFTAALRGEQDSLLPARDRSGVQWAMTIDTSICTGCGACMLACQAENNVPTVGPDDVARGRHMSWIRIDRYVVAGGGVVNEPMPCQHCENAPCEYVCPVNATAHSPDGLNEQIYNRCIGTRFCSNNCPYKVRRFNWFAYEVNSSHANQYNPDVSVRSRGVMEKCTYCVQRIRRADHAALVENRAVAPGEVTTACQDACPTGAILFGQLAERGTAFAHARRDARRFDVLHELGTRPRTQYLAKITNPLARERK